MIVRLDGIKRVKSKGHVYYYHRKTMKRLPGLPGSAEFVAKLRELDAPKQSDALPGTLGAIVTRYKRSSEYTELGAGTHRQYQIRLGRLKPFSDIPLVSISLQRVYDLRDALNEKYSRTAANNTVAMVSLLFNWAIKHGLYTGINPTEKVDKIKRPKNAKDINRPWTDDEYVTVMADAPDWLRVAIAIGAHTGLRESDVANITWSSYDGTAIETRQQKTGAPIWIPAHHELRALLDNLPHVAPNIVTGIRGKPMEGKNLGTRFFQFIKQLRDAGKVEDGISFHGLRHTLATRIAEAGGDSATIAAVTGHSSPRMAEWYSRKASQKRLATNAFELLDGTNSRTENGKPFLAKRKTFP